MAHTPSTTYANLYLKEWVEPATGFGAFHYDQLGERRVRECETRPQERDCFHAERYQRVSTVVNKDNSRSIAVL